MAPGNTKILGRRCVAFFIDLIPAWAVLWIIFAGVTDKIDANLDCSEASDAGFPVCLNFNDSTWIGDSNDATVIGIVAFSAWFLLRVVPQALTGLTLGKKIMGLKTVKADGSVPGWGRSLLREVFFIIDGFAFYLLGLIVSASSTNKTRVGDKVAGTFVIAANSEATAATPPPPGAFSAAPPPMATMPPPAATMSPVAAAPPPTASGPGADLAPPATAAPPVAATPAPAPAPAPVSSDPVWDAARGVYVHTDPVSGARKIYDNATSTWSDDS
jgi:uncharacterized RDD family membrane protein YckC